jgi:hypothetical protein
MRRRRTTLVMLPFAACSNAGDGPDDPKAGDPPSVIATVDTLGRDAAPGPR